MHWIEKRIYEQQERDERRALIARESPKIFDALWTHILDDIRLANQTAYIGIMQLGTEGNSSTREMTIYRPAARERKEVHIKLNSDGFGITVSGIVDRTLRLRICKDGSVCLQDAYGQKIEFREASQEILDPLLFPDLQKAEFPSEIKQ